MKKILQPTTALSAIFLLSIFLLSVTRTEAFDTWLHLSFGRLIWNLHGLPATEPFVLSMAGKPFSYSSWLFGVVFYGAYRFLGIYGIALFKALSVTMLFLVLLKDSAVPHRRYSLAAAILIVIALFIRPRFMERPELFFMLFLTFSIFSLNAYLRENRRYIYFLPLVHCLWSNSHSSITTMVVPFLAVLAGGGLQTLLTQRGINRSPVPTAHQLKVVAAVFAASVGGALLTPYGAGQFTFARQFLQSDVFKQEIFELLPPTWSGSPWYFLLAGVTILSFILTIRKFSFIDLFLLLPFLYLSTTAVRFIYVFAVLAAPVLIRNLGLIIDMLPFAPKMTAEGQPVRFSWRTAAATTAWLFICTAAGMAGQVPLQRYPVKPGIGFDTTFLPEQALSYMDRVDIQGPIYTSFSWGQYIEWRDFPKRQPLMDGRGYMPDELKESLTFPRDPEQLYTRYGIETVLIFYSPDITERMKFDYDRDVLRDPRWALVYFDDRSLVYLRRGGKHDPVIARDEYRCIKPANNIKGIDPQLQDSGKRRQIIGELERNIRETGSALGHISMAHVCNRIGLYQDALGQLSAADGKVPDDLRSLRYEEEGFARRNMKDTARSLSAYEKSLHFRETAAVHVRIAEDLIDLGRDREAIDHLVKAILMDKKVTDAYLPLMSAYGRTGRADEAAKVSRQYHAALNALEAERHFQAGVTAYAAGQLPAALNEFQQTAALDPENGMTYANIGFIYFDSGRYDTAVGYMQKALTLAPKNPIAHYGLAMTYTRLGRKDLARDHWRHYLKIEPRGYYSRQAKHELEAVR